MLTLTLTFTLTFTHSHSHPRRSPTHPISHTSTHTGTQQAAFERHLSALSSPLVSPAPQDVVDSLVELDPEVADTLAVNSVARERACPSWVIELPFCESHLPSVSGDSDPFVGEKAVGFGEIILQALLRTLSDQ